MQYSDLLFGFSDESSSSVCEEIVDKLSFEADDVSSIAQLSIIVPPCTPVVPKRKSRKKKKKSKDCNIKIITS